MASPTTVLATFLFVSPAQLTAGLPGRDETASLIRDAATSRSYQEALGELAYEYGAHPETAAPRMAACLQAVKAARKGVR
ncbi:hypothetical protein [Actinacidiphila glaucinigra]|uniref:hypothetical protein n=1 Tax=Actinacidiphila glaucinigra TaxID=235986 RepID=UPI0037133BDF